MNDNDKKHLMRIFDHHYKKMYEDIFRITMQYGIIDTPKDMQQIKRILVSYNNVLLEELTRELKGNGYFDKK